MQVSEARLKPEWRRSVRTNMQTNALLERVVAVWDQLCQSSGMPALLFFTVLSAGGTGLADRLVHSEFLLRTVGMVIFFGKPAQAHAPLRTERLGLGRSGLKARHGRSLRERTN